MASTTALNFIKAAALLVTAFTSTASFVMLSTATRLPERSVCMATMIPPTIMPQTYDGEPPVKTQLIANVTRKNI